MNEGLLARRNVILAVVIFIILTAAALAWQQYTSYASVTLEPENGGSISFGLPAHDGVADVIVKTSETTTLRVKKGTYAALFEQADKVASFVTFNIKSNVTIKSPDLQLAPRKLKSLLSAARPDINKALAAKLPPGYAVSNDALYDDGTWYGAKLSANGKDTLRVIMHVGLTWQVVAGPSIIITKIDYPALPGDVISQVNNTL